MVATAQLRSRLNCLSSHADDHGLIVRIDEPTDGSSRFGCTVPLRGWIAATATERLELTETSLRFYVERIADRASLLYNGLSFIGTEVSAARGDAPRFSRAIVFSETEYPLPAAEVGEGRARIEFEGELDLSVWSESASLVRVIAKYQRGDAVTLSNQVVVSLGDKEAPLRSYGGFVVPAGDSALRVERVQFEVWAAKAGDPPERAELICGARRFPMFKALAPEPQKVDALPDIGIDGHARFVAALATRELVHAEADSEFQLLPLQAVIGFRSGAELSIVGPTVRLAPLTGSNEGEADIQLLRTLPTGNVEICGVLTMPGIGPVRAFLEARSWRIELHPGGSVPCISWKSQPLLETTEPLLSDNSSSFRAIFSTDALGPTPGAVRLVFEREEVRVIAGPPTQLARISGLMARAAPKQTIATMLCRVGHRRSFSHAAREVKGKGRVLVASPNLSAVEGAPKVLCDIVIALQDQFDPLVIAAVDGALRERYESAGVPVSIVRECSGEAMSWERYHCALAAVATLESERAFTAVLANVIDSYWAVDFARRRKIPSAWIIHESVEPAASFVGVDPRLRLLFLEALRTAKLPLFVAERTAALFRQYLTADAVVIENGIDGEELAAASAVVDRCVVREKLGIAPEAKVVSIVGTTTRRKGQDIFLREMAELRKHYHRSPLRFLIVGAREVPFLKELRALAHELGLDEAVVFVPEQPQVERFFAVSDVMVVASREESAPLVSLEAFAHGVPLVSSRVFGLADQIRDGENALAFELDEVGSLARQVERLLDDEALRGRITATARADLQSRFSRERSLEQYRQALRPLSS